ncbi:MAG: ATP-binding protein [Chlamydiia bacterium]|nr:ATP-binding protein [Chlamydiia bacterium]
MPIGIQSIRKIIEDNYVYVDKTEYIYKLLNEGSYYFMSRPRRFGKSLLISTMEEILKGNRQLFESCHIYSSDYEWKKHPVVHFDFTQIPTESTADLERGLRETMDNIAASYELSLKGTSLQLRLVSLIEQLSVAGKVAILVDEYDKPIIDNLADDEIVSGNRDLIRRFFGTLKGLDSYLKIVFITGVSKFSQVSLFSGFNNLQDMTLRPEFSALFGYTEQELIDNFNPHLEAIAEKSLLSKDAVLDQIRVWYNGYQFSANGTPVYNPFSTLSYLDEGETQGYWYRTGTPSFLIEQIRKLPQITTQLSGSVSTASELLDIQNTDSIDLKALMWQTGYLTIRSYDSQTQLYLLDFPNKEVRSAFFNSLIKGFAQIDVSNVIKSAKQCFKDLEEHNLKAFFATVNSHFAKITYNLSQHAKEGFYHAIFLSLLECMNIPTRAEEQTNLGRIDLVCELAKTIYIFEFKIDQSSETAFTQIQMKNYAEKYTKSGKTLAVIGVNFDSKSRNISDWKARIINPSGELIKELHSLYHIHAKR